MNDRTQYTVLGTHRRYRIAPPVALALLCFFGSAGHAQTLLRWKLKSGESYSVETRQETQSQVAFSGKSVITAIELALQQTWTVTSASEKEFVITQSIDRIQLKLTGQQGTAEYDSSSKTRPSGQTRDLAASLQPLVGAQFELTMTLRGQITAAKPLNASAEALVADHNAPADAKPPSRDSVQRLLEQSLLVLPEKEIQTGDTWTSTQELATAAGKFHQETTNRLAGTVQRGDQELLEIEITTKLSPQGSLKKHEQTGKALFSAKDGRLIEADQTQKLVTERPYRETTIVVSLGSQQKTTLTPK